MSAAETFTQHAKSYRVNMAKSLRSQGLSPTVRACFLAHPDPTCSFLGLWLQIVESFQFCFIIVIVS